MTLWDVLRGAAVIGGLAAVVTVALSAWRLFTYGRRTYLEVKRLDVSSAFEDD